GARRISNFEFRASTCESKFTLLLMFALVLSASVRPTFGTERVWEERLELPPGGHVSVVNVQGSVLVEGWDRAEVEATVAMRSKAPTDQLNDVRVAVETRHGGVAFHTLYPSGLDTPIRVDYRLRVPRQVRLDELSTLEGEIVVRDVDGTIEAHNLHGDIEGINVSGSVVAHALTGNILFSIRALPDRRLPFTLATLNGNVDLLMPAQANADLELSAVAGNIVGDYPFQVSSTPGDSTRHAQVGAGGVRVELRTVRGNIRVGQRDDDL
ncbi:MAG TPA: hypothetical protein VEN79_18930, partial [Terriglobia bacterium]|nr:hypothetical protein [Terriglobia bacterium]